MAVRLLYFAWVREQIGVAEENVTLPPEIRTAKDVVDWLCGRGGGYATAFSTPDRLRCALDQQISPLATPIAGVQEIAFFPPVTGG